MKIGIICSNNDTLWLFRVLQKYDNEYFVYYDFLNWPYGDKWFEYSMKKTEDWIKYLIEKWAEKIILPPVYELHYLQSKNKFVDQILPLFQTYVLDYGFKYSLVGKIWTFGDYADLQVVEKLLKNLEKKYNLTENQKLIKKFHSPFCYRSKEVSLRKSFLLNLSYSDFMVNKTVKFDLRYFKDAMVDTVLPLNYGYFAYEKTISKFFNFKKIRFHKSEKLDEIFAWLVSKEKKSDYSVKIFFSGTSDFITRDKRLVWLMQRWKSIELKLEEIVL